MEKPRGFELTPRYGKYGELIVQIKEISSLLGYKTNRVLEVMKKNPYIISQAYKIKNAYVMEAYFFQRCFTHLLKEKLKRCKSELCRNFGCRSVKFSDHPDHPGKKLVIGECIGNFVMHMLEKHFRYKERFKTFDGVKVKNEYMPFVPFLENVNLSGHIQREAFEAIDQYVMDYILYIEHPTVDVKQVHSIPEAEHSYAIAEIC